MSGSETVKHTVQGYRLSPTQERLWLLERSSPQARLEGHCIVAVTGPLDPGVLRTAVRQVVQRHEILRTTLRSIPGMMFPVQVIADENVLAYEEQDLTANRTRERDAVIGPLRPATCDDRPDAAGTPVVRIIVKRIEAARHEVQISLPACCADGITLKNLVREISSAYRSRLRAEAVEMDEPLQYADVAEWQQALLEDEAGAAGRDYWRKQAGPIAAWLETRLPGEHPAAERTVFTPREVPVPVSRESVERLDDLAARQGISGSSCLLACWGILLQRHIGQADVLIGVASDGRPHGEMQDACGAFAKYLPLHHASEPGTQFDAYAQTLQRRWLELDEWQEYFSWKDVQDLVDPAHDPFFPFCFDYGDLASSCSGDEGLSFRVEQSHAYIDRFKIRFRCARKGDVIEAALHYDAGLYQEPMIACLAGQLATLLDHAARHPEKAVDDLEMVSEAERHRVLEIFSREGVGAGGDDRCLHHLFEAQVERTPERIALLHEGRSVTYRDLDRRANQVARYLTSRGVGAGTMVGLCMERSPDLIVGIVGILKAGGAYVPIDSAYPKERIVYLLQDSRAALVLTQARFQEGLTELGAVVLSLDGERETIEEHSGTTPSIPFTAAGAAYMIYTSGSTGKPKGVPVSHRNAVHSTRARLGYYDGAVSCFLLLSSVAFDSSVAGIFWTLSGGGTLCLPGEGVQKAPVELGVLIEREQVTHVLCLPSLYSSLLGEVPVHQLRSLRTVIVAGESCHRDLVARHHAHLPGTQLCNEYGPTEGTVWSSVYQCRQPEGNTTVPIGRPIAGVSIYLLDHGLRPVPIGIPGELCIAGAGLASGYHNRPALTAQKFIPDPFGSAAGSRLYRTGDLARYRPDGNIEFIGRRDQQVKLRGYRIELGEIEARLLEHPEIEEAVVLLRESRAGETQLVAYLVSKQAALKAPVVKEYLKASLPEYMVPPTIVFLGALPLSPNGKVDRNALPAPDAGTALLERYEAPRTTTEELLAGIWGDVLQVPRVGAGDNFFDLGGHSLLATQVMARVREVFQMEAPVRLLFETTSVAELARVLDSFRCRRPGLDAPPLVPIRREEAAPLSFAQQRLWILAQLDPEGTAYNIPIALRVTGPLNLAALEWSFHELVARHEVLRTTFQTTKAEAVQVIAASLRVPLPVIDLQHVPEQTRLEAAMRLSEAEANRPFELQYGPLVRTSVIRLQPEEHVLLVSLHHIVSDAWSARILVHEMSLLYETSLHGGASTLPELPIQYADFAIWQRSWLSGDVLERELSYWRQLLGGDLPQLELPTDRPRPAVHRTHGATLSSLLPGDLSAALRERSRRARATVSMLCLATFSLLLSRYSGQEDLVVGTPVGNRTRRELEPLIGFFVNTLALRINLSGNPTVDEVVARVRDVCLGAYAHQEVPFEKLVEVLQPARQLGASPIFQVMFDFQHASAEPPEVPGLRFAPLAAVTHTAKFDLSMTVADRGAEFEVSLEYNTDLFEPSTIGRMAAHFQSLLDAVVTRPQQRLSELALMGAEERVTVVETWNQTARAYPTDRTVPDLIAAQAVRTPTAVAVRDGEKTLTYAALLERANQVAQAIRAHGVGTESLVGIALERSLDLVVGLLGIWQAGAAYVPLDPSYPSERLAYMLADSEAALLLTQTGLGVRVSFAGPTLYVDRDWPRIATYPPVAPDGERPDEALAYVIYTSGSTGLPKGAGNTHGALRNRLQWMQEAYGLTAADRVLQKTPISFDVSVWELFWPLLVGAELVLAAPGEHKDPAALIERIVRTGVTTLHFVPPMLQAFLESSGVERCRSLTRIMCSGEALPADLPPLVHRLWPGAGLHNLYGPTEAAIDVTAWACPLQAGSTVPIGRPIANTQIYVCDAEGEPVPIGVPGELYIGGVAVGRGYHRRPALTAERFVPDRFSANPGARLYRTGDLVRSRPDAAIEYLGRLDHQVKIRGVRIELGEIEQTLRQQPGIREAVVVARGDGPKQLVGYVTTIPETAVDCAALRQALGRTLPDYLVPAVIVPMPHLPLSPNGKVDRKVLPAPDLGSALTNRYVAPRTVREEMLSTLWAEVLGLSRVGIHDNFFDLGGHSLLAVRLVSRLQQSIGRPISLMSVFQHPTVATWADYCDGLEDERPSPLRSIQPAGSRPPLYCIDPTGTHVLAYRPLAYALGEDQPVYGITLSRIFSMSWTDLSIARMAAEFAREIRHHQPTGPYRLLGWSNGGAMALAIAQALECQGEVIEFLGLLDTQPPLETHAGGHVEIIDEMMAYISRERRETFFSLPDTERQALRTQLMQLNEEDRLVHAIRWALAHGLLSAEESQASVEALKIGYALGRSTICFLQAFQPGTLHAPLSVWWTSDTLGRHGRAPIDWQRYTRGEVSSYSVTGDHRDAVQSIQVHQKIDEILRGLRAEECE